MSDCRFGVSPVNYPDPDPDPDRLVHYFCQVKKLLVNDHEDPVCQDGK